MGCVANVLSILAEINNPLCPGFGMPKCVLFHIKQIEAGGHLLPYRSFLGGFFSFGAVFFGGAVVVWGCLQRQPAPAPIERHAKTEKKRYSGTVALDTSMGMVCLKWVGGKDGRWGGEGKRRGWW
jgi:hypothetical protein